MRPETEEWKRERSERLELLRNLKPEMARIRYPDSIVQIRRILPNELPIAFEILKAAFFTLEGTLDPPSSVLVETLETLEASATGGGLLLAWEDNVPVGTALFRLDPSCLYVGRLGVPPSQRARGIASALLGYTETIARLLEQDTLRLGTRQKLVSNVALYQRLGYRIVEMHPHPRGPDTLVWLEKSLETLTE